MRFYVPPLEDRRTGSAKARRDVWPPVRRAQHQSSNQEPQRPRCSIRQHNGFAERRGVIRAVGAAALLLVVASGTPAAQRLADLMAAAKPAGDVIAFANEYVIVRYASLDYPAAERRLAEARPVVLYIRVAPDPGLVNTRLLDPPRGARPSWRPGVVARGVRIEVLKHPPPPASALGEPGTNPPLDAIEERTWDGGRLILATFRPFDYGVGTGRLPSVTTFLSDGVIEVSSRGLRRRVWVEAGETLWLEARTRLTVIDDYPVGVAIVQLSPP